MNTKTEAVNIDQHTQSPGLENIKSRSDFRSSHDHAFEYPGKPPEHSYTTDGYNVMLTKTVGVIETPDGKKKVEFEVVHPETGQFIDINDYLEGLGVPSMEDRYPVIAYGANANPASLFRKFDYADKDDPNLLIVPVIKATRKGSEIAWSKKLGARGRQFADMITNDDVADTTVDVYVNFLTHDQIAIMHSTEKEYDIIEQGKVTLEGGISIPGFYYSGTSAEAYGIDGKPVAVSVVSADQRIGESHTAESSLQSILDRVNNDGIDAAQGAGTATSFLGYYESLDPVSKAETRNNIELFLNENNLVYSHSRPDDARVHEWFFNSLATFEQLLNGFEYTGVQGRIFTNDLIPDLGKRALIDAALYR